MSRLEFGFFKSLLFLNIPVGGETGFFTLESQGWMFLMLDRCASFSGKEGDG
jgi:hypothetical protein